jgi:alkylation response protein AidB-like acyl-CoA dehydrogenase
MNFNLNENQKAIQASVADFAEQRILPNRMDWDENQHMPRELFREMGDLGLMGMLVPEAYGGAGMGYFEYKIAIEEISKACVRITF